VSTGDAYGPTSVELTCDEMPRCSRCQNLLATFVSRPWAIKCQRCKAWNQHGRLPKWLAERIDRDIGEHPPPDWPPTSWKNNTQALRPRTVTRTTE